MRALITGGQGFVGQHLERHLRDQGDDVVILDMETDVAKAEVVSHAILQAAPDAIYHLAALSHVGDSWNDPSQVLSVNVIGTANVLAAARQCDRDVTTLVVSSAEVYGIVQPDDLPLTESSPVAPASPYAASKAAAEQVALQAVRGFGQKVIVVRPFNHIGPGQAPVFAVPALSKRIVDAARTGDQDLSVGTLTTRRDFTDVRDVVRAYRLLIEHGESGEIYNICSGIDESIAEIVAMLLEIVGLNLNLVTDQSLIRPVDVPVLRGECAKVFAATGWKSEISLHHTLVDVVESFQDTSKN